MDSYVLCGMQFGDEGKGTFVDYLAHTINAEAIVRYNGGSHASHSVITPDGVLHKFSQLGSGMFLEKCHTFLTENMVINLENLIVEMQVFCAKTDISFSELRDRIHIHENCYVVTPYHKLLNKLRELSKGANRRGSVGTGVSEVKLLLSEPKLFPYEPDLGLQVKDIFNPYSNNPSIGRLEALQHYVSDFYHQHEADIWKNTPRNMKDSLEKEIALFLNPKVFLGVAMNYVINFKNAPAETSFKNCIYTTYDATLRKDCSRVIFEGSQGLLIDSIYGIRPNTTFLDTTINFALDISYYRDNISKIGIAKAFSTRHGFGVFPTESQEVGEYVSDENQEESFWNGKIRFGWFDAVLLRYAQRINQVNELYLSSLDKLDSFKTIKVCNEYIYTGTVDDKFKELFRYSVSETGVICISDILQNDDSLKKYLETCVPKYISVDGWCSDTSTAFEKTQLPAKCIEYIKLLEELTNVPITVVSVGPTRKNKIELSV